MAQYVPNTASNAKTVPELRRNQTTELNKIAVAINSLDRNTSGVTRDIQNNTTVISSLQADVATINQVLVTMPIKTQAEFDDLNTIIREDGLDGVMIIALDSFDYNPDFSADAPSRSTGLNLSLSGAGVRGFVRSMTNTDVGQWY